MRYTMKVVSERFNISAHTLRYYEKEGLLLWVERDRNGIRQYNDVNLEWIAFISCMRATGMSISDIKNYVDLFNQGNETVIERYRIILNQKEIVQNKIKELQNNITLIEKKLKYYNELMIPENESTK